MTSNDPFAGIPAALTSALVARGFTDLTAVQKAVLDSEHSGRDLRISSQTGSGKTIAIGLALARDLEAAMQLRGGEKKSNSRGGGQSGARPIGLIIVPTRELAAQVRSELEWLYANLQGVRVEVVTGGTSIVMEKRALSRGPALVVGTPGRLLDHMRNKAIHCDQIAHVALDEADQMLDMGFRDELEAILEQLPEKRSSHLVSATFPRAVLSLANRFQRDVLTVEGTQLGVANADIQHIAYSIRRNESYPALVNILLLAGDSRCLLFVNRRIDATELAEKLASDGFGAAPFSGELAQAQRTRTLNAFKSGTFNILVSTDVAARGIDVPDISTVVHVDAPRNPDAYTHRSGRTGRAGREGKSILLCAGPETRRVERLLRSARIEVSWQPVPAPDKVAKAFMKQGRKQLHETLAATTPSESELTYAKQLLEEKDPAHLVATLVGMAMPKPPHAPMQVQGLDPYAAGKGRGVPGAKRGARASGGDAPFVDSYTQFQVSWGQKAGATASRLLSHVCRRGGVSSNQVGAIRIDMKSATVDIASDAADLFESKTKRPDKRDPGIVIRRNSKSQPGRGRPQSGPQKSKSHSSPRSSSYSPTGSADGAASSSFSPSHSPSSATSPSGGDVRKSPKAKPKGPGGRKFKARPKNPSRGPSGGPSGKPAGKNGARGGGPGHLNGKGPRRTASR